MEGINVWGIFTFVLPIVVAIIVGIVNVIFSVVKVVVKVLGGTKNVYSRDVRRSN